MKTTLKTCNASSRHHTYMIAPDHVATNTHPPTAALFSNPYVQKYTKNQMSLTGPKKFFLNCRNGFWGGQTETERMGSFLTLYY